MKAFALLLLLLSPLSQALRLGTTLAAAVDAAVAAPLLAERQTPQARFTSISPAAPAAHRAPSAFPPS